MLLNKLLRIIERNNRLPDHLLSYKLWLSFVVCNSHLMYYQILYIIQALKYFIILIFDLPYYIVSCPAFLQKNFFDSNGQKLRKS